MTEKTNCIPEIEAYIEQSIGQWNVPGAAVGIIKDGELVSARGYGLCRVGETRKVNAETFFAIGSNSKAFTAAGLGILVEKNQLHWDDPVVKYLPDFALYDPWVTAHATIRDLLSHRIGVSDVERLLYNIEYTPQEMIRRFRYVQPTVPFRSDVIYSNIAVMAAGEILSRVSGMHWQDFVRQRILEPLGMHGTTTNFRAAQKHPNLAIPHVPYKEGFLSARSRMAAPHYAIAWPDLGDQAAGGIVSNILEMSQWINLILRKGQMADGTCLLSPVTVEAMTRSSNVFQNPATSMIAGIYSLQPEMNFFSTGMGWFVFDYKGRKLVLHGGQVQGMISSVWLLPQENLGIVTFLNVNYSALQYVFPLLIADAFLGGTKRDWSSEFLSAVTQMRKMEEAQWEQRKAQRRTGKASLPLETLCGIYDHDYFGKHRVVLEQGRLQVEFPPSFIGDLEHWDGETYFLHWRNDPFDGGMVTFSPSRMYIENEGEYRKVG